MKTKKMIKQLRKIADELDVKVLKWIPVSERLPEDNTSVLVTFESGQVSQSGWRSDDKYNNGFTCYGHGITEDGEVLSYDVIAWMPLPEPYKEDVNDSEDTYRG